MSVEAPTDPFRCICPLDPADLLNGLPRAVEGCPAHTYRYAFQQWIAEHYPAEESEEQS